MNLTEIHVRDGVQCKGHHYFHLNLCFLQTQMEDYLVRHIISNFFLYSLSSRPELVGLSLEQDISQNFCIWVSGKDVERKKLFFFSQSEDFINFYFVDDPTLLNENSVKEIVARLVTYLKDYFDSYFQYRYDINFRRLM